MISTPLQIAETFGKYFSTVASALASKSNAQMTSRSENPSLNNLLSKFSPIQEAFVCAKVNNLNARKAIGIDKLSNRLLKVGAPIIAKPLTKLFNHSLETGIFPSEFKIGKATALHKSGDRTETSNYRPISVLPTLSKILEKVIHQQVYHYLDANHLLSDHQTRFRPKRYTDTALTWYTDKIYWKQKSNHRRLP